MSDRKLEINGECAQHDAPDRDIEYLADRIEQERAKRGAQLDWLGRWHESLDWSNRTVRFMDQAGIDLREYTGLSRRIAAATDAFDAQFPQAEGPDLATLQILVDSTSGSVYSAATGTYSSYEDPDTLNDYSALTGEYEERQKTAGVIEEVERVLLEHVPEAGVKFRAAWDAFYAGVPSLDPTSGPSLQMRSALDLTMARLMKRVPPPPHTLTKRQWLAYLADHAARNASAANLLRMLSPEYPRLKALLSQVKDTSELGKERLRTLLVETTDFLHDVLRAVDFSRLGAGGDAP